MQQTAMFYMPSKLRHVKLFKNQQGGMHPLSLRRLDGN